MYTVKLTDGSRNLIIENTLSGIESAFSQVVEKVIQHRLPITDHDRAILCVFASAMSARTQEQKENFTDFFAKIHRQVRSMEEAFGTGFEQSENLEKLRDNAQAWILEQILAYMPRILHEMALTFLVADEGQDFITSDEPCVWWNPKLHTLPPVYRHPGLGQKDIEVRLPLTPSVLAVFSRHYPQGYHVIPETVVDDVNRITRWHSKEHFISLTGDAKPVWFEKGQMPIDAWERTHPKNAPKL